MPLFAVVLLLAAGTVCASTDSFGDDGIGFVAIDRQVLRAIDELVDVELDTTHHRPRVIIPVNSGKGAIGDTFALSWDFNDSSLDELYSVTTNNKCKSYRFGDKGNSYVVCVGDSSDCLVDLECNGMLDFEACLSQRLSNSLSKQLGSSYKVSVYNDTITIENSGGKQIKMRIISQALMDNRIVVWISGNSICPLVVREGEKVFARITSSRLGIRFEEVDAIDFSHEATGRTLCILSGQRKNIDSILDVAPSQPYTEVLIDSDQEGASTHGSSVRYARDENGRLSFVIYHVMSIGSWQIEVRELSNDTLAVRVRLASGEADLTANPDKESGLAFHELFSSQTATIHNGRFVNVVYEQYGKESMYNRKAWSVEELMEEIEWGRKIISK